MPRKEPFKRIMVSDRIYEAVNRKRAEESKDDFRPLPMNAYCEKILWDYAKGKLSRFEELKESSTSHPGVHLSGVPLPPTVGVYREPEKPKTRKEQAEERSSKGRRTVDE